MGAQVCVGGEEPHIQRRCELRDGFRDVQGGIGRFLLHLPTHRPHLLALRPVGRQRNRLFLRPSSQGNVPSHRCGSSRGRGQRRSEARRQDVEGAHFESAAEAGSPKQLSLYGFRFARPCCGFSEPDTEAPWSPRYAFSTFVLVVSFLGLFSRVTIATTIRLRRACAVMLTGVVEGDLTTVPLFPDKSLPETFCSCGGS